MTCPHGYAWEGNCEKCHPEKFPLHGTRAKYDQGCRCLSCEQTEPSPNAAAQGASGTEGDALADGGGCAVCGKPIEFVGFGWSHVDDRTVHGHVAKGPKRMSIAEFKAQKAAGGSATNA